MRTRFGLCCAALCLSITAVVSAQDAVKVDAKHYKVESEDAHVRVLRVHYGPHEKSVMHSHPASVAVFSRTARLGLLIPAARPKILR